MEDAPPRQAALGDSADLEDHSSLAAGVCRRLSWWPCSTISLNIYLALIFHSTHEPANGAGVQVMGSCLIGELPEVIEVQVSTSRLRGIDAKTAETSTPQYDN